MPKKIIFKQKDVVWCLFFVVFWLIPLFYTNFFGQSIPFFPRIVNYFHSTSNLFTKATYLWPAPYIQVLPKDADEWITLDEKDYFSMATFGNRTRLFETLYVATTIPEYQKRSLGIQEDLAAWIKSEYLKRNEDLGQLKAVRFIAGLYRVKDDLEIQGRWQTPPIENFRDEDLYVISTHYCYLE